jgi:gliding motility-associated-like protein
MQVTSQVDRFDFLHMKNILGVFIASSLTLFTTFSEAQTCIEVDGILVDACTADEGLNEQVLFRTGAAPLNVSDLQFTWPNTSNTWQGICQDAGTAAKVNQLSATITNSCGSVVEPTGGIIPANSKVLLFTSVNPDVSGITLEGLTDVLYVIFHCGATSVGNFANSGSGTRTLTINVTGANACTEEVTYDRALLAGQNGAGVLFEDNGQATYSVIGCSFFTGTLSAAWTSPGALCSNATPINLNTLVTGTPGGTFFGPGVTNGIFNPTGLSGNIVISYVLGTGTCTIENQQIVTVNPSGSASWTNPGAICDQFTPINFNNFITGTPGGTWSGSGLAGPILFPEGINGPIQVTYTVGNGTCVSTSTQILFVGSFLPGPTVTGGPNFTFCSDITTSPTITAVGYLETAVDWYSDINLTNLITSGSTYNPPLGQNTTVYVSQQYAGCNTGITEVNISYNPPPAPPQISQTSVNFCPGSPLPTLTATTGTPTTVTWYNDQTLFQIIGSGLSFQPLESQAPDIWVVAGTGNCRSTPVQVTLNGQTLSAAWTAPGSQCSNAGSIDLNTLITGNTGGTWSGAGVSGNTFNPAGLSGSIVITYSVGTGSCTVESQQTVQVLSSGDATWNNPGTLCNPAATIQLNDYITGTTGGTWAGTGVAGSFLFTDGINGPISITYSVGSGSCASSSTQTITIVSTVTAPIVDATITYCEGQVAAPINAGVLPGAEVRWYSDAALGNEIFSGNGFVPPANINATYYVTQGFSGCTSGASPINVVFEPAPAAPSTQTSIIYCTGSQIPLLTASASGTITWYNDAGLTQILGTGTSYQPNNTEGSDIFIQCVEGACASDVVEITLNEEAPVSAEIIFNGETETCNFQPVTLQSSATIGNSWSTGETSNTLVVNQAGTYTLTVTGACNVDTDEITLVDNGVQANFTVNDLAGVAPFTVTASNSSNNADSFIYTLNGSSGSVTDNVPFVLANEGVYVLTLVASNDEGCVDSLTRYIEVVSGLVEIVIPNSFTPNGDGFNDLFKPELKGLTSFDFAVFNRYGNTIATWKNAQFSWDGNHQGMASPDGVYFYVLRGTNFDGDSIERSGSITIKR